MPYPIKIQFPAIGFSSDESEFIVKASEQILCGDPSSVEFTEDQLERFSIFQSIVAESIHYANLAMVEEKEYLSVSPSDRQWQYQSLIRLTEIFRESGFGTFDNGDMRIQAQAYREAIQTAKVLIAKIEACF